MGMVFGLKWVWLDGFAHCARNSIQCTSLLLHHSYSGASSWNAAIVLYFLQDQNISINTLVTVCEPYVNEDFLPTLLEGYLEMFFGHPGSVQLEWLLHLANQSYDEFPEIQLFLKYVPKNVVKYFLRNQLLRNPSEQVDSFNVLLLYNNEVMRLQWYYTGDLNLSNHSCRHV